MEASTSSSLGSMGIALGTISERVCHSRSERPHGAGLEHLQQLIGGGYLRDRGTGMSDLVITSRPLLLSILREVEPYVVFKREHVRRALWAVATVGLTPRCPGIPAGSTRGRCLRNPKLFEDEADLRRGC